MTTPPKSAREVADRFLIFCAHALVEEKMSWPKATETLIKEIEMVALSARSEALEEGRNEGLSDAARLAQDHARIKGAHIHEGFKYCVEEVAEQILALKQSPVETGGGEK